MNRIKSLFTAAILSFAHFIYADELANVNFMVDNNLFKNKGKIQNLAAELSDKQKYELYDKYRKNAWWPFCLNFFILPGLGSTLQGDYVGGGSAFALYFTGYGFLIAKENLHLPKDWTYSDTNKFNQDVNSYYSQMKWMPIVGWSCIGTSILYSGIVTLFYTKKYNTILGESLNLNQTYHLQFEPSFSLSSLSINMHIKKR